MKNTCTLRYISLSILLIAFSCISIVVKAQPGLTLTPVIQTGLSSPIQIVHAGDGTNRLFVVQKGGTIRVYDAYYNFLSTFLTVPNVNTVGERGLLSMAFHPDYKNNGFFYVYYTNNTAGAIGGLEIARYKVSSTDPNTADINSKVIVITIPHYTNSNHNGGEMHFGSDGFLYLSTGDGGGAGDTDNNAQNTSVLLGKMLRFNVNLSAMAPYYTIPAGNPYNNEIFALGLRNPYRWSFDRQTNDMWIGDVGQDSFEEINYRAAGTTAGVNYGWRCYEGETAYNTAGCLSKPNYVSPVFNYVSQNPSASVTGGIVYRGSAYPALQGWYIAADFYTGIFYKIIPNGVGGFTTSTEKLTPTGLVDFGEAENGEAFVVSLTGNTVYRLGSNTALPLTLLSFKGNAVAQGIQLSWKTAREENVKQFTLEYSENGNVFTEVATITAKNVYGGSLYEYLHTNSYSGTAFYRLSMYDVDGTVRFSDVLRVNVNGSGTITISPNVITNGILQMNLPVNSGLLSLELVNETGVTVLKQNLAGQSGMIKTSVGTLAKGTYFVRFIGGNSTDAQKILIR